MFFLDALWDKDAAGSGSDVHHLQLSSNKLGFPRGILFSLAWFPLGLVGFRWSELEWVTKYAVLGSPWEFATHSLSKTALSAYGWGKTREDGEVISFRPRRLVWWRIFFFYHLEALCETSFFCSSYSSSKGVEVGVWCERATGSMLVPAETLWATRRSDGFMLLVLSLEAVAGMLWLASGRWRLETGTAACCIFTIWLFIFSSEFTSCVSILAGLLTRKEKKYWW